MRRVPPRSHGVRTERAQHSRITRQLILPTQEYLHNEAVSGACLLAAAVLAVIWANSEWRHIYFDFRAFPVSVQFGTYGIEKPLLAWINDGLMAIFFFVVALEIKREFLFGMLSDRQRAALPIAAALVLGKPIGTITASWLAVRLGIARLPEQVRWSQIIGAGIIGGVGFTVSLFVANLAFGMGDLLLEAKVGVFVASIISGVTGLLFLFLTLKPRSSSNLT